MFCDHISNFFSCSQFVAMINRLHVGFPKFWNWILVEFAAHCPSQLRLIYVTIDIANTRESVLIKPLDFNDFNKRHHERPQLLQLLLNALVEEI